MKSEREIYGQMIQNMVLKAQDGDKVMAQTLAMTYKPLVLKMASTYTFRREELADAFQDGMVVLMKAIYDYDSQYGSIYFPVYLKRRLYYAMMNRGRKTRVDSCSLDQPQSTEDEGQTLGDTLVDSRVDISGEVERQSEREELHHSIEALPPGRQQVIKSRYFKEMGPKAIAKAMGVSVKTVESQHTQAIRQLRSSLKSRCGRPH